MKNKPTDSPKAQKPPASAPYRNAGLPIDQRVSDLLARMTLEEKVAQLYVFFWDKEDLSAEQAQQIFPHGAGTIGRTIRDRSVEEGARLASAIQTYMVKDTRLGIPTLFIDELLHGLMAHGATHYPQAIALASTWNPELLERIFSAAALETRARGSNYALTPVLDLARDPRWGRTEETYGEDPYLASQLGVAAIQGMQGRAPITDNIDAQHVMATAKHYAVHGQPEGGTNAAPGNYSERTIREQFLAPFEAAVKEAHVQAIMASYNEVDGIPVHINTWLLQDVLRDEWGFDGLITSDGKGVAELATLHHVATDRADAARQALAAGIDAELGTTFATLVDQVRSGLVDEAHIDRAVTRVLRAKFMLGLFDQDPAVDVEAAQRITNCKDHQDLALEAARQAMILLKNEDALLPLDPSDLQSIAVIGPNAAHLHVGGYSRDPGRGVHVLAGIQHKVGDHVDVRYAEGCRITAGVQGWHAWDIDDVLPADAAENETLIEQAVQVARDSDVAILVVGGNEGTCREGWSQPHLGDRADLNLFGQQNDLVKAVVETGTPTVMILINGRPLTITYAAAHVPAILECWYLGQESGTAIADALFGDVNPGGKLPITFPRSVGQLPAYYYQKPSAKRGFLFTPIEPLFPFGHGLSYTTFVYDNLRLAPQQIPPDGTTTVSVDITNSGPRAGDEIVQLYIRDCISSVTQPVKLLKGFKRITLQPEQTQTVTFELGPAELSFLDKHMQRVVEPGQFDIMIGRSSADYQTVQLDVIDKK